MSHNMSDSSLLTQRNKDNKCTPPSYWSEPEAESADILCLPANVKGKDYAIGDVHGEGGITKIIKELTEHDRLFLVGDLVDNRNPQGDDQSAEILKYIMDHIEKRRQKGQDPQVYVTKGNHEAAFSAAMKKRNKIFVSPETARLTIQQKVAAYKASTQYTTLNTYGGVRWTAKYDQLDEKGQFVYNDNELCKAAEFCEKLPTVIHVRGNEKTPPFLIVHADMPISDEELLQLSESKNFYLSENDQYHAFSARATEKGWPLKKGIRTSNSILVICGHTPFGGLRKDTNSVNVDVLTFLSGAFLRLNITDGKCEVINTESVNPTKYPKIVEDATELARLINEYLAEKRDSIFSAIIEDYVAPQEDSRKQGPVLGLADLIIEDYGNSASTRVNRSGTTGFFAAKPAKEKPFPEIPCDLSKLVKSGGKKDLEEDFEMLTPDAELVALKL
jgi:hypothetical protein